MSLRLNSVKGYSEAPWYVKFKNNDTIEFRPAKMQIGGLLVGDRTFDFCETSNFFYKIQLIYLMKRTKS